MYTVLRDVSTGAVTRISNLQNQKAKNEQKQSRNRKQSRRNEIEGKEPLKFLHKNFQKTFRVAIATNYSNTVQKTSLGEVSNTQPQINYKRTCNNKCEPTRANPTIEPQVSQIKLKGTKL